MRDVLAVIQIKVRPACQREDLAIFWIHQNDGSAFGLEFREAGFHFLFDDRLQSHVDGELHIEPRARRQEAGGIAGHHKTARIAVVLAPSVAAREIFLHGLLNAEAPDDFCFHLTLFVQLLGLAGESDQVRRKVRRGIPTLDGILKFESLQAVAVDGFAESVGDVFGQILGERKPIAFLFLDLVHQFRALHAKWPRQHAHGIFPMLAHDFLAGVALEDFAAQADNLSLPRGRVQSIPAFSRAQLLAGKTITRLLRVIEMLAIKEKRRNRNALGDRFLAAIDNHATHRRKFFDAVKRLARALRITLTIDQLDLHQPPREHTQPDHEDR